MAANQKNPGSARAVTIATRDGAHLTIVKTEMREWTVCQGDTQLRIFKKLCWARLYVVKNVGRKCPCGALIPPFGGTSTDRESE